jgi:hypothetical protein
MIKLAMSSKPIATMSYGHVAVELPRLHMNVKNDARFSEKRYLPTVHSASTTPAIVPAKQIL